MSRQNKSDYERKNRYISDTDNYTYILRWRVIVFPFFVAVVSVKRRVFYITINIRRYNSLRCQLTKPLRVVSTFRSEVDTKWAILDNYAASSGNLLETFRDSLSVPSAGGKETKKNPRNQEEWPLKMGSIGCPEKSVRNYHYLLRNDLEQRISQQRWEFTDMYTVL